MAVRESQMKYIYISKKFGQGPSNLISDVFSIPNCKTILGRGFSPAFLPQAHLYQNEDCSPTTKDHCYLFISLLPYKIYPTWGTFSGPETSSSHANVFPNPTPLWNLSQCTGRGLLISVTPP